MALSEGLRSRLKLPAICAPMFLVSGPDLVREACKAGVIGGLPRPNARSIEEFEGWLRAIDEDLRAWADGGEGRRAAPIAVNFPTTMSDSELNENLAVCRRYNVEIVISVGGNPTAMAARVHDFGWQIYHDVTSLRFADRAIKAGVDGLNCIGAGGGGHSGTISHLALIPQIRSIFDGTIVLAGAVSNGTTIRAAEILGADLAYLGTRFIATEESLAPADYKQMLVDETSTGLFYTGNVAGVPANWLLASIRHNGLDPANLPEPTRAGIQHDHLPDEVRPWKTLWSAGQGIDLIHDVPSVDRLVRRLRREYVEACAVPDMADAARLAEAAFAAPNL